MSKLSVIIVMLALVCGAFGVINFVTDGWIQIILSNEKYAPNQMAGHSAVLNPINNTMIVFGGHDNKNVYGDRVYKYDLVADSWFGPNDTSTRDTNSSVPSARWGHVAITTPYNTMYVFGGTDGTKIYNDIYKYNMVSDRWEQIKVSGIPPAARFGHSGVMYPITNEFIFFGGAIGADGLGKTNELVRFNFETNTWAVPSKPAGSAQAQPPFLVGHSAVMTLTNQMVVFGGVDSTGRATNGTFFYDAVMDQWLDVQINYTVSIKVPARAYHATAITALHQMIVFGGVDSSNKGTSDIFKYDFTSQSWSQILAAGDGPQTSLYGLSATVTLLNTIMIFGGQSSDTSFYNDIFKYNVVNSVLRSSTDGVILVVLLSLVGTLIIGLCFALDLQNERNEVEKYERLEREAELKGQNAELRKLKALKEKEARQPLFEKLY
ncbi:hypothetical protein DFA_11226 [Cavenderia fasciculata]|uniref:Galactose oxidase n=1 Tax=Cavenderia fasciculata TaxID=261658 RepID=F4QFL2_CACFS|nr:uncharacterized protein DFA_11226 [Cavenderia fasciculata]EGG13465.1 hypothetical protein DFA_11226 [Cavenderia fasciculata]|eukprot:XP_004350169.1 hypothetical protein DFA_11226 [Cavenderia fasciculata]